MVAPKHLLLFAAAAYSLVVTRTFQTVLTNLEKIDTDTKTLTSAINSWDGSIGGSITIQDDENAVDNDVKAATNEAKTEPVASSANSKTIIAYVNNSLGPDTHAALNALVAKKSQFAAAGLTSTVESDLKTLKSDVDALGAALVAIASSDQKSNGQAAITTIDGYFTTAINAFS